MMKTKTFYTAETLKDLSLLMSNVRAEGDTTPTLRIVLELDHLNKKVRLIGPDVGQVELSPDLSDYQKLVELALTSLQIEISVPSTSESIYVPPEIPQVQAFPDALSALRKTVEAQTEAAKARIAEASQSLKNQVAAIIANQPEGSLVVTPSVE